MSGAPAFDEDSDWRERLSLRLTRGFWCVFALSAGIMAVTLTGSFVRWFMTGVALLGVVVLGAPAFFGWPRGAVRAWCLIVPCLIAANSSLALLGFLSAPGVILALTLMLSGILLGRRVMWLLGALSVASVATIAWSMVHGYLPPPRALNASFTNGFAWMRTMGVSMLATGLFGSLTVAVIDRMEHNLKLARSEALRREQAERERLEARQLETVGRLAAGVAHDFNNNLTAIIGCAELLQTQAEKGSQSETLARIIVESSRNAAQLTGQLLAYSRQAQMVLVPTDVHRSLESAISLLRRSIDPSVELAVELAATSSVVAADASLLQNALLNVLVNARDAMPQGGKLEVRTFNHGEELGIEIRDNGSGIPEEALSRIFEPFFTTKPLGEGTGLGLAAVAGTMSSLGGRVTVESELGRGSSFRLQLPLSGQPLVDGTDGPVTKSGRGEILIVDDQPLVRRAASAALVALGYQVVAVDGGAAAIELVRAAPERFDLVLLDLRMPGMSGEATFDALLRLSPDLPVLVWSGFGAEQDLPEMLRRGAAGFLPKPYAVADLGRMVAQSMRRREPIEPS